MRIQAADLHLTSGHLALERESSREQLRTWIGDKRPVFAGEDPSPMHDRFESGGRPAAGTLPALRHRARQTMPTSNPAAPTTPTTPAGEVELTAEQRSILLILEHVFGMEGADERVDRAVAALRFSYRAETVRIDMVDDGPEPRVGWGLEYDRNYHYLDYERTGAAISGSVTTLDGRTIELELSTSLERRYELHAEIHLRAGDAQPIDPLVLDLDGDGPALATRQRTAFDLDGDGDTEEMAVLAGKDRFLVWDRDGDGVIADGRELFGPRSGNGFAELTDLDADGNGWLDAGDPAFAELGLWRPGDAAPTPLAAAGIGALATTRIASPFAFKDVDNATTGLLRATGLYLREDGRAGTLHRIDFVA